MAKKYVTPSIFDNLTFYLFGRVEREIEGLAERTGVPKSDFADRLSALFPNAQGGTVLGLFDQVPAVPENSSPGVHVGKPALAVGERPSSSGVHHEQSATSKIAARSQVALEVLSTLESPAFCGDVHRLLREKGKMTYAAAHHTTTKMFNRRVLEKQGIGPLAKFFWTKESLSGSEAAPQKMATTKSGGTPSVADVDKDKRGFNSTKKPPSLPKGEPTKIVLKLLNSAGKNLTKSEICQKLIKKYPNTTTYVWNGVLTTLVKLGRLRRGPDGMISIVG